MSRIAIFDIVFLYIIYILIGINYFEIYIDFKLGVIFGCLLMFLTSFIRAKFKLVKSKFQELASKFSFIIKKLLGNKYYVNNTEVSI